MLKSFIKNIKPQDRFIAFFLIKALALYILWFLIYDNWLLKDGFIDNFLVQHLANATSTVLNFLGYTTFLYADAVGIDGTHGVLIGVPCNGIDLLALFAGFIVIFPGKLKHKIIYILSGLALIHVLNIIRLTGLAIVVLHSPDSLDFNHKYTFTIIMYAIVFLMWIFWVKKFSSRSK